MVDLDQLLCDLLILSLALLKNRLKMFLLVFGLLKLCVQQVKDALVFILLLPDVLRDFSFNCLHFKLVLAFFLLHRGISSHHLLCQFLQSLDKLDVFVL